MKIALDVDVTLTDMNDYLIKRGKTFFSKRNKPILNPDATTAELMYGATAEEVKAFWKRNYVVYCIAVQLKPNLKHELDHLRAEGHSLHVVTARIGAHRRDLLGRLIRYALIKKFECHGVFMDSYTFTNDAVPDDKLNACRSSNFDTIVEDNPNHIEKIARNLRIPVIVMSTPENAVLEMDNLIRIKDLSELGDAMKQAEIIRANVTIEDNTQ